MARTPNANTIAVLEAEEEEILAAVVAGDTINVIARRYKVCRRSVYNWIRAGGRERQARFDEARRESAAGLAEEAMEILDAPESAKDPATASMARERAKHRQWLASKYDRATFGEQPAQINVGFNVGALHLEALRQHGSAQLPVADVRLLDDGGDESAN